MTRADLLFVDCIRFWERMGIEKEYNLKCMATLDVVQSKIDGWEEYNDARLVADGHTIHTIIRDAKYNENRGRADWLRGQGL